MALVTGFGLFIVSVLTAALSRTLAEEIEAWIPSIIRSLIKLAVVRLPESQRERFEEEWQSHVSDVPGKVAKLIVAAGFLIAAYKIALIGRSRCTHGESSLACMDEAIFLLNLIQNYQVLPRRYQQGLPRREDVLPEVASSLRRIQKLREELAADVSAASDAPQTSLASLSYALRRSAIRLRLQLRLQGYRISLATERALEKSAEAVKRIKRVK
jgi:hypothetical protein